MASNTPQLTHNKIVPRTVREYQGWLREMFIQAREMQEWGVTLVESGQLEKTDDVFGILGQIRQEVGGYLSDVGFDLTDL